MHWEAPKRHKPNQPKLVELTPKEQVKQEWVKEVKILQNMCAKDIGIFTHLKIKGAKMVGDKSSGVTKELLMGVETGIKSMQEMGESIYAVLMDGTSRDPNIFRPVTTPCRWTRPRTSSCPWQISRPRARGSLASEVRHHGLSLVPMGLQTWCAGGCHQKWCVLDC
jgi:hypothetical protein